MQLDTRSAEQARVTFLPSVTVLPLALQAQSQRGWWLSDLDIKCYSNWHSKFALAFGLPCLLLLCLGIPLVAAALPVSAWKRNKLQDDHYRQSCGFLHWRYR